MGRLERGPILCRNKIMKNDGRSSYSAGIYDVGVDQPPNKEKIVLTQDVCGAYVNLLVFDVKYPLENILFHAFPLSVRCRR